MTATDPKSPHAENVVWSGSVSQWHYAGRWFVVLLLLAAVAGSFLYPPAETLAYIWPVRGGIALVALLIIGSIALDRRLRRYTITTVRVSVEYGVLDKRSNEIRVQDIRSINLYCSGISGMFGIGRLEFSSAAADDAEVIFWKVAGAEKIRDLVRSLQTK